MIPRKENITNNNNHTFFLFLLHQGWLTFILATQDPVHWQAIIVIETCTMCLKMPRRIIDSIINTVAKSLGVTRAVSAPALDNIIAYSTLQFFPAPWSRGLWSPLNSNYGSGVGSIPGGTRIFGSVWNRCQLSIERNLGSYWLVALITSLESQQRLGTRLCWPHVTLKWLDWRSR